MKRQFALACLLLSITHFVLGQTLSETQMRNARATGYAIVAARNPGKSFSIYVIPWDGVNTLEYNANTQINSGWHAQAAIKGNYFSQNFDGSDFSQYSTVVVSQVEFDLYKSTGTQWWIVCSILPTFSNSSITIVNSNGNVGINNLNPGTFLDIKTNSTPQLYLSTSRTFITSRNWGIGTNWYAEGDFAILESTTNADAPAVTRFLIDVNGNVGIGTTTPDAKLTVKGDIHTREVKVDLSGAVAPDYVFEKDYYLLSLTELETYINQKKHLPEVPSAKEMEANGLNLKEMNLLLLKKVEELTLHLIEQNNKLNKQTEIDKHQAVEIEKLKSQVSSFKRKIVQHYEKN